MQAEPQTAEPSSSNVHHVTYEGRDIYIVGTAHISQRSVDEVRAVIDEVRPDTVCIELDEMRYAALMDPDRWRKLDIFQVIRERKVLFFSASLVLSSFQRKLGQQLGVEPGAEMRAAADSAKAIGARLVLADRDVQATLKRTWANLSFADKLKVSASLMATFFSSESISEEQIEELKDRDHIGEVMQEFARAMPGAQVPLIDERDRYLMASIREAPGQKVVGVVGAGHVSGMLGYLHSEVDREALSRLPRPSRVLGALKWVLPMIVLGAFYFGYREHSGEGLRQMLYAWILPNSVAAAVLSAVAGARLMTVAVAFVASPITSLNPTIGAGMFAGLMEAWLRKPTVEDCERLNDDISSVRGVYRNRFARVLLVAVAATLGSALGAWVGATWVVSLI